MISEISFLPHISFQELSKTHKKEKSSWVTPYKVEYIAYLFFGGLFSIAGVIALASLGGGFFTAIPFFLVSGAIFWKIQFLKNYEDANELKKYREEALKQPLTKTIKLHSWTNMIKYQIPEPKFFPKLFHEAVQKMPFPEFISFYEETQSHCNPNLARYGYIPFGLPEIEEFKYKWKEEIAGKAVCEVLAKKEYDIRKLIGWGFVTQNLLKAQQQMWQAWKDRVEGNINIEEMAKIWKELNDTYQNDLIN